MIQTWKRAFAPPAIGARRRSRPLRGRRGWSVGVLLAAIIVGLGLALRPAPAESAPLAPDFTLPAASGAHGDLSLRTLRGHPVLLNFFNTQCGPCLDEMPRLRQAAQAYRSRGVVVLGVATGGDTVETARRLAAAVHLPYPVVADVHQAVAWNYNVGGWPTTFFVDKQGHLRGQYWGAMDAATIRDGLAQAGAIACAHCSALAQASLGTAAPAGNKLSADILFPQPHPAPMFTLRDQQGRVITPRSLRGKVVALTFVSALCKEQCPLVGQTLTQVQRQLGRDASRLVIVAISVDPEVDTTKDTYAFARESGWRTGSWHYLTAPRSVLQRVWASYYIGVPAPPPIYKAASVVHQAEVGLIDPRGNLRAYYDVPFLASRVTASVRALLHS